VASYKVEQRHISFRGRIFHFVSYEQKAEGQYHWFLMNAGSRWEVMPQVVGEDPEVTDRRLLDWLERTMDQPAAPFLAPGTDNPIRPSLRTQESRER
jgi:hypothetical protein